MEEDTMTQLKVGILGATGMVGKELIKVLFDREFPIESLKLYASKRSVGKKIETPLGKIAVENVDTADYSQLDIAFFAISGEWSKEKCSKKPQKQTVL